MTRTEGRRLGVLRQLGACHGEVPAMRTQQVVAALFVELGAEAGILAALVERADAGGADLCQRAVADSRHIGHGVSPQAAWPRGRAARAALACRSALPTGRLASGLRRKVRPLMVSGVRPATFPR